MAASAQPPAVEEPRVGFSRSVPPGLTAVSAVGLAAGALVELDLAGRAFVAAAFCAVLAVLAAIDLERRLIPNRIVLPAAALVLLGNIAAEPDRAAEWAIAAGAAGGGALLLALLTRGGVGMGDVKLCLLLGAGLGFDVLAALFIGVLAGALAALVVLVRHGLQARKAAIPYGPFLALGGILVVFLS